MVPKIAIMTMVFGADLAQGRLTDERMLDALERMGFDGVEPPSGRLLETPAILSKYTGYLANSKLRATCVDGICNFIHREAEPRQKAVAELRAAIDAAHALQCPVVLAAGSNLSGDITPSEGRKMIIEGLQACMSAAKDAGVTLAIEDFGVAPTLQCAAADCLEILQAVPGLGFVFDTGNFYFRGEDPLKNLDTLGAYTRHVHLKDWVKSDKPDIADVSGAPLGAGIIPNADLVRRLVRDHGVASFSLELGAPGEKLAAAQHDLETLRGWLRAG